MWTWESELRFLGFRRRSEGYWRCEGRHGLPAWGHLSLFPWAEQRLPGGRRLIAVDTFHVTLVLGGEHLHFYYHERAENHWEPGGHTSRREIRRLGQTLFTLRELADEIAGLVVAGLGAELRPRGSRCAIRQQPTVPEGDGDNDH